VTPEVEVHLVKTYHIMWENILVYSSVKSWYERLVIKRTCISAIMNWRLSPVQESGTKQTVMTYDH